MRSSGGDFFFLHVDNRCAIGSNFLCEEIYSTSYIFTDSSLIKQMTDNSDGTYTVTYQISKDGYASVQIFLAKNGGFLAEYFNNAFLDGVPALTRLDSYIDFDWGTDLITNEAADFVSARWYGKVKAPSTEEYTFIVSADDGVRLYIEGLLVVDRWDTCCDDVTATVSFV